MELISSIHNSKIKNIIKLLAKSRERKSQNLIVVEGARELTLALEAGYPITSVFVCEDLFRQSDYPHVLDNIQNSSHYQVTLDVFGKIAYRENSDGVIALLVPHKNTLESISLSSKPFIIVLEAIEKPGNLGAVLRTADAASADAVIVCDPLADLYNPNVIRSSIGCIFTVPVAVATSQEAFQWLKKNNIAVYAAELGSSDWYQNTDFTASSAIVMGTEAKGLTNFWLENSDKRIKIPMRGKIDSLNVSVSTAVLTFEAMRQRGFK